MEVLESKTINNKTINIHFDPDPLNPRKEFDNAARLFCFHRRYQLGDDCPWRSDQFEGWGEFAATLKRSGAAIIQPLYLYDHSGLTIQTGPFACSWDSGQVGFAIMYGATIKKEWGEGEGALEKATACLEAEVKTYDAYLTGQVFGYRILETCGACHNPQEIDSCWGFYSQEEAMEAAVEAAD